MARAPLLHFMRVFRPPELQLPGLAMFGRYQFAASQMALLPHAHPHAIEICFLERGEQTYRVGGKLYRLHGHDQFFTLPGEVHDTARLPQERGILYWLILRLDPAEKFLGLSPKMARRLGHELRRMPARHFRAHPDCARLLGQMVELLSEAKPGERLPPFGLLRLQSLMLEYLTLTIDASRRGAREPVSPLIDRVLRYVDDHLEDPIHVAELAAVARLSESRFKSRFKRETGVPPAEYWLRKKIERAVKMLKTQSVTEVAHALGFSSSQYFATAFKRYTLANPREFIASTPVSLRGRAAGPPRWEKSVCGSVEFPAKA